MLATRWEPLFGTNRWQRQMNHLLSNLEQHAPVRLSTGSYPQLNLLEDEENFYLEAELPGLALEDLELLVTGGDQLAIKGTRTQPNPEQASWHRQERGYGSFSRTVDFPTPVDADKVAASLTDGILTVTLPKSEAARPRKIAVKAD